MDNRQFGILAGVGIVCGIVIVACARCVETVVKSVLKD